MIFWEFFGASTKKRGHKIMEVLEFFVLEFGLESFLETFVCEFGDGMKSHE